MMWVIVNSWDLILIIIRKGADVLGRTCGVGVTRKVSITLFIAFFGWIILSKMIGCCRTRLIVGWIVINLLCPLSISIPMTLTMWATFVWTFNIIEIYYFILRRFRKRLCAYFCCHKVFIFLRRQRRNRVCGRESWTSAGRLQTIMLAESEFWFWTVIEFRWDFRKSKICWLFCLLCRWFYIRNNCCLRRVQIFFSFMDF